MASSVKQAFLDAGITVPSDTPDMLDEVQLRYLTAQFGGTFHTELPDSSLEPPYIAGIQKGVGKYRAYYAHIEFIADYKALRRLYEQFDRSSLLYVIKFPQETDTCD